MKCHRSKCTRAARRQGLCAQHYRHTPLRGYVDSTVTKERIELLLSLGVGWAGLESSGVSFQWWRQSGDRVQARVEAKVMSIPVPRNVVPGGCVPAIGSIRKLKALAAMGWPFSVLGPRVGHGQQYFSQILSRQWMQSRTAASIDSLYRELAMTEGPSQFLRDRARRRGWVSALAWIDIDDPNEQPDSGERVRISADEELAELQDDLGITDINEIASHLRIKPDSVQKRIERSAA